MNRYLFKTMLVISSTLSALAPLYAASPVGDDALAAWVQNVNARLDKVMPDPTEQSSGTAWVEFRRSPNGLPTDVVIHAASGDLRRAAKATIARVGILPPLPAGYDFDTKIGMQLLFSTDDQDAYLQMRTKLLASAALSNHQLAVNHSENRLALFSPRR